VRVDLNPHSAPEDPHLVCRREIFDNVLVEAARRDVDVCEGWSVRGVVARGNTVSGVIVRDAEGATHEIAARAVVGADGYNSAIARSLGLYRHDSTRWWVGTRAYYRGLDVPARTVEIHYVDDILPGFLWFFPTGDGVVNVGLGMIHRTLKRSGRSIRDVHRAVVASPRFRERFAGAEELGDISGWHLPTPDAARAVSGPGFLLAGDAAGLVDPFSGEGIGNAMCSGEVAARTVADICSSTQAGTPQEAAAFARYDATLWNALDKRELALHYRLRSLAKRRWIIDLLVGRAAERSDVLDWFVAMTDEHGAVERKRALTSPLTYLKLLFMGK
jgi:flavin-dependent dehydrogenase